MKKTLVFFIILVSNPANLTVDKLISSDYELSQFIIDSLEKKNLCVVSDWNQDIYLVLKIDLINQDRDLLIQ